MDWSDVSFCDTFHRRHFFRLVMEIIRDSYGDTKNLMMISVIILFLPKCTQQYKYAKVILFACVANN